MRTVSSARAAASASGLVRAALFYGWWYPSRWIGWSFWPRYGEFGWTLPKGDVPLSFQDLSRLLPHVGVGVSKQSEERRAG